ncbi:hypothetical protein L3X38_023002 [Prunus dulcis]|uniref:Reverse transcriptase Ty1/copia-type domain-containing protein n=1 Tax=Prunus dulcis TaxID=3755 RepID=A0AAD4Z5R0_PRUDU|nr:hypothetical protein L3X38_023002 [Prunus dulcis]
MNHSGYRCLDPVTGRVFTSRHVIFHEDHFPFTVSSSSPSSSSSFTFQFPIKLTFLQSSSPTREVCTSLPPVSPSSASPQLNSSLSLPSFPPGSPSPSDSPLPSSIASLPSPAPPPQNTHSMVTRSKNGITKPKALFATQHPISSSLDHLSLFPTTPTTYKQAVKSKVWQDAMQAEFDALLKTNTWTLVPPSSSQNIVGCKWVYRIKHTADGSVERYKARLVAKGFHQQEGLDYTETFSPVAKPVTIRLFLSLAVQFDWFLNQLDVSNAFLHGSLKEDVFMEQPPGFLDSTTPHYVCKLNRSLYGLKQAPRAWYEELFHSLLQLGFRSSQADSSLFIKNAPYLVFILVYVDDILVTGRSSLACHQVIKQLSSIFPVKDLGPVHYFLGLEVHRSSQGLALSQTKYAYDLLQRTDFLGAKPCSTPLGSSKLDLDSPALSDPTFYRSTVGALQYLTWTRPDLAFAVNQVCQHMHNPRESHLAAVKRILRYLKGTLHLGLWFKKGQPLLQAFSNADWAGCPVDRRSTSGLCVFLGPNLLSWSAKKQTTVARSSTEAEYRSVALAAAELVYLAKLFKDIGFFLGTPPLLWVDNQSAISLASNPVFHARTKHVEVDYHFTRELVQNGSFRLHYVCSSNQLADIFTKSLSSSRFVYLRSKLSVCDTTFSLRGADRDISRSNPSRSSQSC